MSSVFTSPFLISSDRPATPDSRAKAEVIDFEALNFRISGSSERKADTFRLSNVPHALEGEEKARLDGRAYHLERCSAYCAGFMTIEPSGYGLPLAIISPLSGAATENFESSAQAITICCEASVV